VSHISELIRRLCPTGVEFRKLGEVVTNLDSQRRPVTRSDRRTGEFPYYGANGIQDYVDDYLFDGTFLLVGEDGSVVQRDGSPVVNWASGKIWVNNHAHVLATRSEGVELRYLYFYLQTVDVTPYVTGVSQPKLNQANLNRIPVAVPPIELQREIAHVLDLFSGLTADLATQLDAELDARQRQHAFYWASLLTPRDGWRTTTLSEVAEVFDGPHATPKKTDSGPWYLSISSLKSGRFDLAESAHLSEDEFLTWTRRVAPRFGDTMFSYETRLGQAAYWDRDEPAALGRRMGLLRPRTAVINPRFLTLAYLGPQFQKLIEAKTVHGSTVDRIPIADMAAWEISIPALTEQQRIVDLLDKFDALATDLSTALPAEITARRKQYEYYRDRLLTFKELAA
jgi:type I restriction enzyme, S subunit